MTADFPVILDACVLVQACLRDTLLRLFQARLFLARWSDDIVAEVRRTLENKLHKTPEQTEHLVSQLREYFADAWVEGYADLIASMTNDGKDRHILAAAIRGGCESIITFNSRHFPAQATDPFNIAVVHPDEFLIDLYYLDPDRVVHVLHEQGSDLNPTKSFEDTRFHQPLLHTGQRRVFDSAPAEPAAARGSQGCRPECSATTEPSLPLKRWQDSRVIFTALPALLDPLLCLAALVVKLDHLPVPELRFGHDEAYRGNNSRDGSPPPQPPSAPSSNWLPDTGSPCTTQLVCEPDDPPAESATLQYHASGSRWPESESRTSPHALRVLRRCPASQGGVGPEPNFLAQLLLPLDLRYQEFLHPSAL